MFYENTLCNTKTIVNTFRGELVTWAPRSRASQRELRQAISLAKKNHFCMLNGTYWWARLLEGDHLVATLTWYRKAGEEMEGARPTKNRRPHDIQAKTIGILNLEYIQSINMKRCVEDDAIMRLISTVVSQCRIWVLARMRGDINARGFSIVNNMWYSFQRLM